MPPDSLPRRPVDEGRQAGAVQQCGDARVALGASLAEQAAEEVDVLATRQVGIEILARPCGM